MFCYFIYLYFICFVLFYMRTICFCFVLILANTFIESCNHKGYGKILVLFIEKTKFSLITVNTYIHNIIYSDVSTLFYSTM